MRKHFTLWMLMLALVCACLPAMAEAPTTDRAGNAITLPETIETIITLAPSITQVVVDLGKADQIVAIDTYSVGIEGLPEGIPAFDMMTPDAEQIIALNPDVLFVTDMSLVSGDDPFAPIADAGICVAHIPSSGSIAGIMEDTLFIGQAIGEKAAARQINDDMTAAIEAVRVETDSPVPVYFEISPMPSLYSFGSGTFLNEMIEILGGVNIFAGEESWITPSEETVIAAAPEIIFTNADWQEDAVAEILGREGWESIPAVANGRVYLIDGNASSQPNHHIVEALNEMAAAFAD